jgi:hypothetical protein
MERARWEQLRAAQLEEAKMQKAQGPASSPTEVGNARDVVADEMQKDPSQVCIA